jgi:hypothetical protein
MLCHMHGGRNIFFPFSPLGLKRPIEISGPAGRSIAQLQNHCQERFASFTYHLIGISPIARLEVGQAEKKETNW